MAQVSPADRYQREHAWLGFPLAVLYKSLDDRAPRLAAMVTYYAFASLFPLVLLFVSIVGFALDGDPHLRHQLTTTVADSLPGLGPELTRSITGFTGSGVALAVGIVGVLYGALGATTAAQGALNAIYGIPRFRQPDPFRSRVRALGLLVLLGLFVAVSTGVAAVVSTANGISAQLGPLAAVGGYVLAFVLNTALFSLAFELLTALDLEVRNVLVGGVIAGAAWELLQTLGSRYIAHELSRSTALYGTFGVVVAALLWIYLQALVLMVAAEVNVVLHRHLWPRALASQWTLEFEPTEADRRAYRLYLEGNRFKPFQEMEVRFAPAPRGDGAAAAGPPAAAPGEEPAAAPGDRTDHERPPVSAGTDPGGPPRGPAGPGPPS